MAHGLGQSDRRSCIVQIISLNCSGVVPESYKEILPIFEKLNPLPDLVVIGLQEVVKATVREIFGSFFNDDKKKLIHKWCYLINNCLYRILNTERHVEE